MWPSLFEDPEAKEALERLSGYDERIAFMVAAVDAAFRNRVKTGMEPLEAYAKSVGEIAKINALVEGYSPEIARQREIEVREKTWREGLDDPKCPHEQRILGRTA